MELEAIVYLAHDAEPYGTSLVDACNGFSELIQLAMLWTVCHHWPAGTRVAFNCYRHWAQIILNQLGDVPVILLR